MISLTEGQLLAWLTPVLWPFLRVLALFQAMPVLGQRLVPMRVRVGLAFLVAVCASAVVPAAQAVPLDSAQAVLLVVQQLLVGLSLGFAVRIVFAAVICSMNHAGGSFIAGSTARRNAATIATRLIESMPRSASMFASRLSMSAG